MRLILIRHGETEINASGNTHRFNDTQKLNQAGISQIKKTADILKGYDLKFLLSSSELRAQESASLLATLLNIETSSADGFEERN